MLVSFHTSQTLHSHKIHGALAIMKCVYLCCNRVTEQAHNCSIEFCVWRESLGAERTDETEMHHFRIRNELRISGAMSIGHRWRSHSSFFTGYWGFSDNFENPFQSAAISKSICERFCRTSKHLTAVFPLSASTESKLLLNDFRLGLLLIKFSCLRPSQCVLLVCGRSTPRWRIVIYFRCDKSSA